MPYDILILGAAYGSLLASKMLFGGHRIHHICLPAEAELINTVFPHPTLSEMMHEAVLDAYGRMMHM